MKPEDEAFLARARTLGLEKAAEEFPADTIAAAAAANGFREGLGTVADTTSEPWPPMRVAGTR